MAESTNHADLLKQTDVRLCRLYLWRNFKDLGFHLKPSTPPPHTINMIESNSPAAASGLKIWDLILAVNNKNMSHKSYDRVQQALKAACEDNAPVELLVVGQKHYKRLKKQNVIIDSSLATFINTPAKISDDFANFPRLIPRICNLRLGQNHTTFGFETTNGENDIGIYIQTISPDSPASNAGLCRSDRIIEINDRNVDKKSSEYINRKIKQTIEKGVIKLFVADTHTYEYYMKHNMIFSSTDLNKAICLTGPQTVRSPKANKQHNITKTVIDCGYHSSNSALNRQGQGCTDLPLPRPVLLFGNNIEEHGSDQNFLIDESFDITNNDGLTNHYPISVDNDSHILFQPPHADTIRNHSRNIHYGFKKTLTSDIVATENDYPVSVHPDFGGIAQYHNDNFISAYSENLYPTNVFQTNDSLFNIPIDNTRLDYNSNNLSSRSTPTMLAIGGTDKINYPRTQHGFVSTVRSPMAPSVSLTDLREPNQTIRSELSLSRDVTNVSNGTIEVCLGDITKHMVDAIVIASTSDSLRENILQEAGFFIKTTYDNESRQQLNKTICTNGGNLACKRIYFIPCPQMSRNADKWTFRNFVSEAIEIATNDSFTNIQSIAFPAIGCGQYGCDSNYVANTLIMAVAYELEQRPFLRLHVYFIIQQHEQEIFDAFQNELTALKNNNESRNRTSQLYNVPMNLSTNISRYQENINGFATEKRRLHNLNEYNMVLNQFLSTMTTDYCSEIVRIELIWNERWYKQYMIHKEEFFQRLQYDSEAYLFHGCSEDAANSIIKECFNRSYAGEHGTNYGQGVYFSSQASYSHSYTTPNSNGERCMFLAKVLIGRTIIGNSSMKVCPTGYDTTTDRSHIYVIYHDAQAFGYYLITYI